MSMTTRFPLAATLAARRACRPRKVPGDRKRVNIVSSSLCDDVLDHLAPSLERHENCDIIEVNPGPGLWSSKFHDHVKPRSHILLEPDATLYEPFLKPLLDRPDSRYRLAPYSGFEWASYRRLMDEGLLPHQNVLPAGDARLDQPNNSLLFLATLASHPPKKYGTFGSESHLLVSQLLSAIPLHAIFQAYGLVRMLIWIPDQDKKLTLPKAVADRRKVAVTAETSSRIFEIAGMQEKCASSSKRSISRHPDFEMESMARVLKSTKTCSSHRQRELQRPVHSQSSWGTGTKQSEAQREMDALRQLFMENKLAKYKTDPPPTLSSSQLDTGKKSKIAGRLGKKKGVYRTATPEYARLLQLERDVRRELQGQARLDQSRQDQDHLYRLERAVAQGRPSSDAEAIRKPWEDLKKNVDAKLQNLNTNDRDRILLYSDDKRALEADVPTLMWDRRTQEPLNVEPDEFLPEVPLALLDIQPKPLPPRLRDSSDVYDYYTYIISLLFLQPKQTVREGLEALAPGASAYILPRCLSIRNPFKGGRLDLDDMRVRMLTPEMFEEIAVAWEGWPFKPSMDEFVQKMGVIPQFKDIPSPQVRVM